MRAWLGHCEAKILMIKQYLSPLIKKQPRNLYFQAHPQRLSSSCLLSPLSPTSKAMWKHKVLHSLGAGVETVSQWLPDQQQVALVQVVALWHMQSKWRSCTSLAERCKMHTAFILASVYKGVVAKVLLAYHEIMVEAQRYARHYTDVQSM